MDDKINEVIIEIDKICQLLEKKEKKAVYENMPFIINKLSHVISQIIQGERIDGSDILEPLNNMMQAMENKDSVLLMDVLQYGIVRTLKAAMEESGKEN